MEGRKRYISGSFCVSITAAMGMPKFETGPQKSAGEGGIVSRLRPHMFSERDWR